MDRCVVLSLAEQQSRCLNAYVEFRLDAKRVPDEGDDVVALFNHN